MLEASVKAYAPHNPLLVTQGGRGSFGADYNAAMTTAFESGANEIIIANDDVVLNKDTVRLLMEDVRTCRTFPGRLGFVAARSDNVRSYQSVIENRDPNIIWATAISPVFAYIEKAAFAVAQFPPINWYSDDVMCEDLKYENFRHYISRSFVHHAGSMTIGLDNASHVSEARPWIEANRPSYIPLWF